MPDYSIFGGCLRSDIAFPELRELSSDSASWTLLSVDTIEEMERAQLLGEFQLNPELSMRLFEHASGFRFEFDDTGSYDISADGGIIRWLPGPSPGPNSVRADITGRVLAMALHAGGRLCLHGSAVATESGAVAFVAPKFHGKSTLALALTRAGYRLMTDDVLPVDPGPPARAIPGVHQVKLWDDSAELFDVRRGEPMTGDKHLVHEIPEESLMFQPSSLSAVYLLSPLTGESSMEGAARRIPIPDVTAALALVRHAALGSMLGGAQAARIFERAATLASTVPVYRLETVAGLDRLNDVVAQLQEWHGTASVPPVAAGEGM